MIKMTMVEGNNAVKFIEQFQETNNKLNENPELRELVKKKAFETKFNVNEDKKTMGEKMKLYRVNLRNNYSKYGTSYVVASDSNEAYLIVRKYLDENNLCFSRERELSSVELIADSDEHSKVETFLFTSGW